MLHRGTVDIVDAHPPAHAADVLYGKEEDRQRQRSPALGVEVRQRLFNRGGGTRGVGQLGIRALDGIRRGVRKVAEEQSVGCAMVTGSEQCQWLTCAVTMCALRHGPALENMKRSTQTLTTGPARVNRSKQARGLTS